MPRPRHHAGLARLTFPTAVAATPDGGFLVAETERHRVRRVSPRGIITTIAGTGRGGFSGDGGPATRARLNFATGVARLPDGAIAIADQRNDRVRLVDPAGAISSLAAVRFPDGLSAAADGGVLVVQSAANRILPVDPSGRGDRGGRQRRALLRGRRRPGGGRAPRARGAWPRPATAGS